MKHRLAALLAMPLLAACAADAGAPTAADEDSASASEAMRICPRWVAAETVTVQAESGFQAYASAVPSTTTYGNANCEHAFVADFLIPNPIPNTVAGWTPHFVEEGTTGYGSGGWNPPNLSNLKTAADCATFHFNAWIYEDVNGALTLVKNASATGVWTTSTSFPNGICETSNFATMLELYRPAGYITDKVRIAVAASAVANGALVYYPVHAFVATN
jgi:hypothetical protein